MIKTATQPQKTASLATKITAKKVTKSLEETATTTKKRKASADNEHTQQHSDEEPVKIKTKRRTPTSETLTKPSLTQKAEETTKTTAKKRKLLSDTENTQQESDKETPNLNSKRQTSTSKTLSQTSLTQKQTTEETTAKKRKPSPDTEHTQQQSDEETTKLKAKKRKTSSDTKQIQQQSDEEPVKVQSKKQQNRTNSAQITEVEPLLTTEFSLICDQATLNDQLDFVSRSIATNPTRQILSNILIEADETKQLLHAYGYNLEFGMSASLDAIVMNGGQLTVPASLFQAIVRKFPAGECSLTGSINQMDDNEPNVRAILATTDNSEKQFEFKGFAATNFPPLPTASQHIATFPGNLLLTILSGSLFAASHEETKKILNGSHFIFSYDTDKKLTHLQTWTTDGHRIAFMHGLIEDEQSNLTKPLQFTVPIKALRELERSINSNEQVSIYFEPATTSESGAGIAVFSWANKQLATYTIEGHYPNCATMVQALRDKYNRIVTIERLGLQQTLERFTILSTKQNKFMTVELNNDKAKLRIELKDISKGTESIPIKFNGEFIVCLYDVKYLLDLVKAIKTPYLCIHLADATTPTLFVPYGNEELVVETEYILAPLA